MQQGDSKQSQKTKKFKDGVRTHPNGLADVPGGGADAAAATTAPARRDLGDAAPGRRAAPLILGLTARTAGRAGRALAQVVGEGAYGRGVPAEAGAAAGAARPDVPHRVHRGRAVEGAARAAQAAARTRALDLVARSGARCHALRTLQAFSVSIKQN